MRFKKAIPNIIFLTLFSLLATSKLEGQIVRYSELKKPEAKVAEQQPDKKKELDRLVRLYARPKDPTLEIKSNLAAIGLDSTTPGKMYATMGTQKLGIRSSLRIRRTLESTTTALASTGNFRGAIEIVNGPNTMLYSAGISARTKQFGARAAGSYNAISGIYVLDVRLAAFSKLTPSNISLENSTLESFVRREEGTLSVNYNLRSSPNALTHTLTAASEIYGVKLNGNYRVVESAQPLEELALSAQTKVGPATLSGACTQISYNGSRITSFRNGLFVPLGPVKVDLNMVYGDGFFNYSIKGILFIKI